MKILLACDERSSADKLYCDLGQGGLPEASEVYVLSVADIFVVPNYKKSKGKRSPQDTYFKHIDQEVGKAQKIADKISKKLKAKFPQWQFHAEAVGGAPAWEIVNKAKDWKVDLIMVGSHGRVGVGEFFFGSVAMKVLSEAGCSVRVIRPTVEDEDIPSRIIIGVDGSSDSEMTINAITARTWKEGSSAHLITSINPAFFTAFLSDDTHVRNVSPRAWIKKTHTQYRARLEKAGLIGYSLIEKGDPKIVLLKEALDWRADCIFVGAKGHSQLDRLLAGSVSAAIAARAHCSVEVVRRRR